MGCKPLPKTSLHSMHRLCSLHILSGSSTQQDDEVHAVSAGSVAVTRAKHGPPTPPAEQIHFPSPQASIISTPSASADCDRPKPRAAPVVAPTGRSIDIDEARGKRTEHRAAGAAVERRTDQLTRDQLISNEHIDGRRRLSLRPPNNRAAITSTCRRRI